MEAQAEGSEVQGSFSVSSYGASLGCLRPCLKKLLSIGKNLEYFCFFHFKEVLKMAFILTKFQSTFDSKSMSLNVCTRIKIG